LWLIIELEIGYLGEFSVRTDGNKRFEPDAFIILVQSFTIRTVCTMQ
jgi:hypothetical protein